MESKSNSEYHTRLYCFAGTCRCSFKKEPRMGRAAGINLAPAATGAAIATTKALPQYAGKFDGIAVRVPVPVGSISDITFIAERPTTIEEINQVLIDESKTDRYKRC
ncbi:hypothetical protein [Sphingobacterium sp. E70]|uniref:hypothetical protein n=1 Tax=Sphingobacterium sp. E70 TaxID=2853439 RepID=UPI00211CA4B7|nr:hypothetical protein [Sphingobacterium sp. E70]